MEKEFEEFWKAKPKRQGSNPKHLARLKFKKAVAEGEDPKKLIGCARAWAKFEQENKTEAQYISMASTWLHQRRFEDFEPLAKAEEARLDAIAEKGGYRWNGERYEKVQAA